ncbi:SRPBCC family protein [Deinococcus aestuarii]|uniref:SRPBCC family protein n=1 Tax=Deinococcus aestuarii TaxID=2774531 RepID=UPI001C0B42FC|nr:SRPBCC domain-containing protein [Deinococcus aestuarii]
MITSAAGTRSIVVERYLAHPAQKVWRALTEGDLVAQWLMPGDFRAVVGHRFTLRAPAVPNWNGVTEGEVLEVVPCGRLVYRWHTTGAAGDELSTLVTWTLQPVEEGVVLRMEQSGFRPQDEPNFRGATQGWPRFLARLEQVIASFPPEATEGR